MSLLGSINQFQNNSASGARALPEAREAVRTAPAQGQELTPGKVFEGTVTDIRNGQVTLGLSDGQSITARMEAGVHLQVGEPMLFEVKSNTGDQISIRPVSVDGAQNPTLLKALEAAGLKPTERNLSMVNEMMIEQLPIGKSSLQQMARALASFPQADIQTLAQMQKLGFAINEESLTQFQSYKNGQQAILPEMTALMEGIADLPEQIFGKDGSGGQQVFLENIELGAPGQGGAQEAPGAGGGAARLSDFQQQLLKILFGDTEADSQAAGKAAGAEAQGIAGQAGEAAQNTAGQVLGEASQNTAGQVLGEAAQGVAGQTGEAAQNVAGQAGEAAQGVAGQTGEAAQGIAGQTGAEAQGVAGQMGAEAQGVAGQAGEAAQNVAGQAGAEAQNVAGQAQGTDVASILSQGQQEELSAMLKAIPGMAENAQLFSDGQLNTMLSSAEMLQQIMKTAAGSGKPESTQKLFLSKEYKALLKQAMAEQWTLTPEQLKEEGAVKEFYQRLNRQMAQLSQFLSQAGKEGSALADTARSLQGSLDFMNQLNQMYAYVQLPLKLQNQNAHSDLYVYTNKKKALDRENGVTALLHLDLDHLGATDIYVKLMGTSVQADFYLEDAVACRLLEQFSDQLSERLEQKGYQCQVQVENRKKEQDFVQDFLEQERPAGKVRRYSFDVKA